MPDGSTRSQTAPFVPTDPSTLLSEGAFKLPAKPDAKQDVGIEGFFAPNPVDSGDGVITSLSPQVSNPVLGLFVYTGAVNPNGAPQSVYSLDKTKLTRIGAANLRVGQTVALAGGVSVRFDGWVPWASIQVSHDPTQGYLLFAAVAMVVGTDRPGVARRPRLAYRDRHGRVGPQRFRQLRHGVLGPRHAIA